MSELLSRKFIFAIIVVVIAAGFVFRDLLTAKEWCEFAAVIGITYIVGNVAEKGIGGLK